MRAKQRRYEQTAKGKATKRRYNAKRIWLNRTDLYGMAPSAEEAKAINAYITRRRVDFVAQQRQSARAEAEGV